MTNLFPEIKVINHIKEKGVINREFFNKIKSQSAKVSYKMNLVYAVVFIPLLMFLSIMLPIMGISDGFTIIKTGYSIYGYYIILLMTMSLLIYLSLKFKALRRIYMIFPSLFETLKYLMISSIFVGVGVDILNWSYMELSSIRKIFGVISFIVSLILWRIFVFIIYKNKYI